jgi:hypothetical protein
VAEVPDLGAHADLHRVVHHRGGMYENILVHARRRMIT